jgi:hypothetical protein
MSSPSLRLRLCSVKGAVQEIVTNPLACIGEIEQKLEFQNTLLIWRGQILSPTRTFDFYKMTDNEAIIAVPQSSSETTVRTWLNQTVNSENFQKWVAMAVDRGAQRNEARLRDLSLMRLERKPRLLTKFAAERQLGMESLEVPITPSVPYRKGERPGEEPLPAPWAKEAKQKGGTKRSNT